MTRSRHLWLPAAAASLGFHAALGVVILVAVDPDPLEKQEPSESQIEIVSYNVDRTEAAIAAPTTEPAAEAQATGSAAGTAAIPITRASAAAAPTTRASASPLPLAPALGATPPAARLAEASPAPAPQPALEIAGVAAAAAAPASSRPAEIAPERAEIAALALAAQTALPVDALAPDQQHAALQVASVAAEAATPAVYRPVETAPAEAIVAASAQAVRLRAGTVEAGRLTSAPPAFDIVVAATAASGSLVPEAIPQPERARPTQTAALAVASLATPVLTDVSPAAPLATTASLAAPLATTVARIATELPVELAAPAPPSSDALDGAMPTGDAGPAIAPLAEALAERPPAELATGAPSLAPPAAMVTAALAWSGGTEAQVDPLSLAAIQSFMQEGDLSTSAASAGTVRDAITGLLASVPCARLQTTFVPETGHMELRGHIPDQALRAPVLAALHQQVGGSIPLADNMLILPRPQCGALASIEAIGLPQSADQHVNPKVLGPDAHARVYNFTDSDDLVFDLTGADYPAYVYIDYFDADGAVIHLQPNETVPLRQVGIAEEIRIGAEGEAGIPWIRMTVAPPYGQEIVVAFVSTQPLYEGLRPLREPAGPYLDLLRTAVADARRLDPAYKGEWVYFFVATAAR